MIMLHPDKRGGNDDRREELQATLQELRMINKTDVHGRPNRCRDCETQRQIAEEDFLSSIHYNTCYSKIIQADAAKFRDGDLTMFADIRDLSDL